MIYLCFDMCSQLTETVKALQYPSSVLVLTVTVEIISASNILIIKEKRRKENYDQS